MIFISAASMAHHILRSNDVDQPKLSFLVLPLLRILSSTRHAANEETAIFSLASQLLSDIENSLHSDVPTVRTESKVRTQWFWTLKFIRWIVAKRRLS